ncbi:unnamed protein product [Ectocarpus fasciculatus]
MSFRGGAGRGGGRGFSGGGRGGRGGGRGRGDEGPPAEICELGSVMHDAEGEVVCRLTHTMIPYFNAGIYLENKSKIGKVEEVFGPVNKVYFTIKTDPGVQATSFKKGDCVFIGTDKLLPLARFTNESKPGGRGGGRGGPGGRGGRGGGRGAPGRGRGPPGRGGGRGAPAFRGSGFSGRGGGGRSFGGRGRG